MLKSVQFFRNITLKLGEESVVISLPEFCKDEGFLAMDRDGKIHAYDITPFLHDPRYWHTLGDSECVAEYQGDDIEEIWENSMVEFREYDTEVVIPK